MLQACSQDMPIEPRMTISFAVRTANGPLAQIRSAMA